MNRKSRPFRSFIAASFLVVSFLIGVVQAQKTTSPERGFHPGNSYDISSIENINPLSGNLMLNVPLGSLPPGRGGISAGVSLNYNSKIWDVDAPEPVGPNYWQVENLVVSQEGGWRYNYYYNLKIDYSQESAGNCGSRLLLVTPDGAEHLLWLKDNTDALGRLAMLPDGAFTCAPPAGGRAQSANLTFYTLDGTFMRVEVEGDNDNNEVNNRWTVYLPDGTRIIHNPDHVANPNTGFLQRIIDRNGNSIDFIENSSDSNYSNHRTTTIKDQLDRKVVIEYSAAADQDWIHSKGYNNTSLVTKVLWKTITVRKTFLWCIANCSPNPYKTTATNFRMVDKIYLPAPASNPSQFGGLYYAFDYNADATSNPSIGWGEVNKVTLPSGAYSTYTYTGDSSTSNSRAIGLIQNRPTQKTLNYLKEYDGSSSWTSDTWTYSSCGSSQTVKVCSITAPDGSISTEYYGGWNGADYPTVSKHNEGFQKPFKSVSGDGSVIERVYANNLPSDDYALASANQFVKYEMTSITNAAGTLSKTAVKEYAYDKNGNVTLVKEYDYFPYSGTDSVQRDSNGRPIALPANASNYLKRITVTNYYNDVPDSASTTYTDTDSYHLSGNPRLLNLVKSSEVQDGSLIPKARTEISYDYTDYGASNTKGGNLTNTKTWDSYKGGNNQAYSNPLGTSNSISTSIAYDTYGNPTSMTNAKNFITTFTYGCIDGQTTCSANLQNLYPTQTVVASGTSVATTTKTLYDFSSGLATQTTFIGNNTNENIINQTDYDALGRPITVKTAVGTAQESWTQTVYEDSNRRVITKTDLYTKQDALKVGTQFFDQLGRVRLAKTLEDALTQSATNETDGIKVQTRYLPSGICTFDASKTCSFQLVSNPYRANYSSNAGSETTMGWTRSQTINTGRHSENESFSGAPLPQPFLPSAYNTNSTGAVKTDVDGDRTLITDQASKQRISKTNALGQLINVWEVKDWDFDTVSISFPGQSLAYGYETSYSYDTLGNLSGVTQGGQTRTFTYTSLSRLKSATNPESGSVNYTYDDGGNPLTKVAERSVSLSIKTIYAYDALNRITSREYKKSDGSALPTDYATPTVTYTYDDSSVAFSKGKLTKVYSTVSETRYTAFDAIGNILSSEQITDGQSYPFTYKYYLSGALMEEKYPSGRIVRNLYDASGDLAAVSGRANQTNPLKSYAGNISYSTTGGIEKMQLGNTRWETTIYNARMQPVQIGLGTSATDTSLWKTQYSYGELNALNGTVDGAKNNGNVAKQIITAPNATAGQPAVEFTQNYTYDQLNRLKSATEPNGSTDNWKQTFNYDRFGNRTFDTANTTTLAQNCTTALCNPSANTADNKFYASNGYGYDSAGNMTANAAGESFVYDAENKLVKYFQAGNLNNGTNQSNAKYGYDGDGRRVRKTSTLATATEDTVFVYNAFGKLAAEYNVTPQVNQTASTKYLTQDTLGSPRVITKQDGAVESRGDFLPFGEDLLIGRGNVLGYNTAVDVRQGFTGYQKDQESELNFAKARMYGGSHGRFTSPDPLIASAKKINPQTWNRYIYVGNNPLKYTDASGLIWAYENVYINGKLMHRYRFFRGDKAPSGWTPVRTGSIVENTNLGTIRLLDNAKIETLGAPRISGIQRGNLSAEDLSAIKNATGGLLCSGSAGLLCLGDKDSDEFQNAKTGADAVQYAFLVKTLLAAGLKLGVIAAIIKSNPDDVLKIATKAITPVESVVGEGVKTAEIAAKMKAAGGWIDEPAKAIISPDGRLLLLDGHHRYAAAQSLGWTNIPVQILKFEDLPKHHLYYRSMDDILRTAEKTAREGFR